MEIPDFDPARDAPTLREWLARATAPGGTPLASLHKAAKERHHRLFSRETLRAFIVDEHHRMNVHSKALLANVWEYLRSDARHVRHFPNQLAPSDAGGHLAVALQAFFGREDIRNNLEDLNGRIPGSYVMYYPDQRMKRSGKSDRPLARATLLEIATSPFGLLVSEKQEWEEKLPYQNKRMLRSEGVAFLLHKYVIALLKSQGYTSFKCIVFTKFIVGAEPGPTGKLQYSELKGEILSADQDGPLPSVRFFCRRFKDLVPPHHGTMPYDDLDNEVVNHIKSSDPLIHET